MEKIDLQKSSNMTAQNSHRVVMIYDQLSEPRKAIGNCFVDKTDTVIPKVLTENDVDLHQDSIHSICYYETN